MSYLFQPQPSVQVLRRRGISPHCVRTDRQTVGEWLDTWLETYAAFSVKPYTESSCRAVCKNHIKPALGRVKLAALSTPQIQRLYNRLVRRDGLSPKTAENVHGVLHRALNQAVKTGLLRQNPADACDLPKVYQREIVLLEQDEITAFLDKIHGHKFEYGYLAALFTGLRQGRRWALTWDCVDFAHDAIYINKQLQRTKKVGGTYALVPTKNSRSRIITAAPSVMTLLKKQKSQQAQMWLLAGQDWKNPWDPAFTNDFGGNLSHFTVYKTFREIVWSIGLEQERFRDLRHPYVKHTTKNILLKSRNPKLPRKILQLGISAFMIL